MEEKQLIALIYHIHGVYGDIDHIKLIDEKQYEDDKENFAYSRISTLQPDVHFNLETQDCNTQKYIDATGEILGLPEYVGIDMGTYFKMAQLREIGSIGKNIYIPNKDKEDFKEILNKIVENTNINGSNIGNALKDIGK